MYPSDDFTLRGFVRLGTGGDVRGVIRMLKRKAPQRTEPLAIPRLCNKFTLGADPELMFIAGGAPVFAAGLRLAEEEPYGADHNGRLAEIRPAPSKSALEMLASMLQTMRWLALLKPGTRELQWHCDTFMHNDGLGGHLHIGKHVPTLAIAPDEPELGGRAQRRTIGTLPNTRQKEITALDILHDRLENSGVFNHELCALRRGGDAHGQRYGRHSDVRVQPHGYEYRTFPSWLDSPWQAFLTVTLGKLAVIDPELLLNSRLHAKSIEALLAYYKGRDDDAMLAHEALQKGGLPKVVGGDFRERWGITYPPLVSRADPLSVPKVDLMPPAIPGDRQAQKELFMHLTEGTKLQAIVPTPSWSYQVPKGFVHHINGERKALWDGCIPEAELQRLPVGVHKTDTFVVHVSRGLISKLPRSWRQKLAGIKIKETNTATYPLYIAGSKTAEIRKAAYSGAFPLWAAADANVESYKQWLALPRCKARPQLYRKIAEV